MSAAAAAPQAAARRRIGVPALPWILVILYALVLVAVSWHRWGAPINDVGLDLNVAERWLHGTLPYRDVRYWYGPLGIGVLSVAFAIFGASLWVAACVGFVQTIVIAELTRRIALRWLPVPVAAATVAVVLSIGFSGSLFNFVLPHTFAATMGTATLLAVILALTSERWFAAGLAVGLTALTRPEFFAFGVAAVAGAALGAIRQRGWQPALRGSVVSAAGAALVAVPILGFFAIKAGLHRLLLENIFPVEFLRVSGSTFEHAEHPLDLPSFGTLITRGVVIAAAVLIFLALWARFDRRAEGRSVGDRLGLNPVRVGGIAIAAVVLAFVLAAAGGDVKQPFDLTKSDTTRFLIPMTALPAVAFATAVLAFIAWVRGKRSPLDEPGATETAGAGVSRADVATDLGPGAAPAPGAPGWIAAGALIAAAFVCTLRIYAQFSTDVYGTYYAPPAVLLGAVVVWRITARFGAGRVAAATTGLTGIALALSAHAVIGLYDDFSVPVHTPAGTFKAQADVAPQAQGVVDLLKDKVKPGDRVLALPQEPGWVFFLHARPALYDSTFLPGVLGKPADDERAANALLHGGSYAARTTSPYTPPKFVIEGTWNFEPWGFHAEGVDVNAALHRAIVSRYRVIGTFGNTGTIPPKNSIANAWTVYELDSP